MKHPTKEHIAETYVLLEKLDATYKATDRAKILWDYAPVVIHMRTYMSSKQLANKLGLSTSYISNILPYLEIIAKES